MRDNHGKLSEIVNAFEEGANYFGVVQLERNGERKRFRFGMSREGYLALKRVLQLRVFGQTPDAQYRYFFVPNVQRLAGEKMMMTVRVEQGPDGKQVQTESVRDLEANLLWFFELDNWSKAEHLAVIV